MPRTSSVHAVTTTILPTLRNSAMRLLSCENESALNLGSEDLFKATKSGASKDGLLASNSCAQHCFFRLLRSVLRSGASIATVKSVRQPIVGRDQGCSATQSGRGQEDTQQREQTPRPCAEMPICVDLSSEPRSPPSLCVFPRVRGEAERGARNPGRASEVGGQRRRRRACDGTVRNLIGGDGEAVAAAKQFVAEK